MKSYYACHARENIYIISFRIIFFPVYNILQAAVKNKRKDNLFIFNDISMMESVNLEKKLG